MSITARKVPVTGMERYFLPVYCRPTPQDGKRSAPALAAFTFCAINRKPEDLHQEMQSLFTSTAVMALWLLLRGGLTFQGPPASWAFTYWLFLGYLLPELLPSPWTHSDQGCFSCKDPCCVQQGQVTTAQSAVRCKWWWGTQNLGNVPWTWLSVSSQREHGTGQTPQKEANSVKTAAREGQQQMTLGWTNELRCRDGSGRSRSHPGPWDRRKRPRGVLSSESSNLGENCLQDKADISLPSLLCPFLSPMLFSLPTDAALFFPMKSGVSYVLVRTLSPEHRTLPRAVQLSRELAAPSPHAEISICQEPEVNISNANHEKRRHADTLGLLDCLSPRDGGGTNGSISQERPPVSLQTCGHRWAHTETHMSPTAGAFCLSAGGCVLWMKKNDRNEMQDGISGSALITKSL